ncbi:hypothetical protein CR513_51706, partial [Mucuna pruriens]
SPRSSEVVNSSSLNSCVIASDLANITNFDFDPTNIEFDLEIDCDFDIANSDSNNMAYNDRTLKELATLDVLYQPWFIQYPKLEQAQSYELKSRLIHLLSMFHGLTSEDPHKYLKEFHVVFHHEATWNP